MIVFAVTVVELSLPTAACLNWENSLHSAIIPYERKDVVVGMSLEEVLAESFETICTDM